MSDSSAKILDRRYSVGAPESSANVEEILIESGEIKAEDISPLDLNLDKKIEKYQKGYENFNPFHYEYLISTALTALQTCFSLRSDAQELEIQLRGLAVEIFQLKVEVDLFNSHSVRFSQQDAYLKDERTKLEQIEKNQKDWLNTLEGEASDNPIRIGDISDGKYQAIIAQLNTGSGLKQNELESAEQARLATEAKAAHQLRQMRLEALELYRDESGNAYNYRQRIARVREIFERTFETAFNRLKAASIGIGVVWNGRNDLPVFPKPNTDKYLDDLFKYCQKISIWLDEQIKNEHVFMANCSMRYGTNDSDDAVAIESTTEGLALFNGSAKTVKFKLDRESTNNLNRVRVRGVNAFLVHRDDANSPARRSSMFAVKVTAPSQTVEGKKFTPQPVRFECGSSAIGNADRFYGGDQFRNIDPTAGEWELEVNETIGSLKRVDGADGALDIVVQFQLIASSE